MKCTVRDTKRDTLTGYDFTEDEPLTRTKAIRAKCLECRCNNAAEVRRCRITDCALWPWRMGRRLSNDEKTLSGADSDANNI